MGTEEKLKKAMQEAHEAMDSLILELESSRQTAVRIPHTYENKNQLAQTFGVTRQCVGNWYPEFEAVVKTGRYGPYAILDNQTNVAAFADFIKYRKWFKDASLKKHVPMFRLHEAINVIIPETVAQ